MSDLTHIREAIKAGDPSAAEQLLPLVYQELRVFAADAKFIAGEGFNGYDRYVAEQDVARIAKEIVGSSSEIADINRGPKNQIVTGKLRDLGMVLGGEAFLRQTVAELIRDFRKLCQKIVDAADRRRIRLPFTAIGFGWESSPTASSIHRSGAALLPGLPAEPYSPG